jgi:hypothetical protein
LIDFTINESFQQYIDYGEQWYKQYIVKGISPEMTSADYEWLKLEMNLAK